MICQTITESLGKNKATPKAKQPKLILPGCVALSEAGSLFSCSSHKKHETKICFILVIHYEYIKAIKNEPELIVVLTLAETRRTQRGDFPEEGRRTEGYENGGAFRLLMTIPFIFDATRSVVD